MNKGIIRQIIIAMVILAGWNLLHLGYNYQQHHIQSELTEVPMIILSGKYEALTTVKTGIDTMSFINEVLVEKDSLVATQLIEEYELHDAGNLLERYSLPNVMTVYLNGRLFRAREKLNLEQFINEWNDDFVINYDNEFWQTTQDKLELLKKGYWLINGIFLLLLLFISVLLRIHFEAKSDEFWRIYKRSGGQHNLRAKRFFIDSLWIILIPVILNFGAYYAGIYYDYLQYQIEYLFFGIETGVLIFSMLISRIILGKKI